MKKTKLIAAATLLSSLSMASGVTLQLDLGGGALFDGTDNATNAPAGIADTFYNGISGNANLPSSTTTGLVFGDGTAATGVTVQIGDGAGPTLFDGTFPTANNNSFSGVGTGVGGTNLTNDWIFTRNGDNLGVRVLGLEAGLYDVYALVREPNQLGRAYSVGIGVGNTGDIADLTQQAVSSITDNTAFIDGGNFVVQRVEVTSTAEYITVIVDPTNLGTDTEARFGSLGGLQIVSVPEPSSVALLGLGLMGFARRRRR